MRTMLLSVDLWDLVTDAAGNIAVADAPYALAQDAASAIKLFRGELYFNTLLGVPYFPLILGEAPPEQIMKEQFERAALRVPGVVSAECVITSIEDREVRGQVKITSETGETAVSNF